jgi:transcriptional regulator with XRE-family HTH domain
MTLDKRKQLFNSLSDKEYRKELAVEHVNTTLAVQIRNMREKQPWNQSELADRLGKHQESISQWENPDYGRYSLTTLKSLAAAFDVALLVKFVPFSELINDMVNLSETRLSPPSYDEERIYTTIKALPYWGQSANLKTINLIIDTATATLSDIHNEEPPIYPATANNERELANVA